MSGSNSILHVYWIRYCRLVNCNQPTILRTRPQPPQGSLKGLTSEITGLTVVHLGQAMVGTSGISDASGISSSPILRGVMSVVTIHTPPTNPIKAPRFSIGYANQYASATNGISSDSRYSGFLVFPFANKKHVPNITTTNPKHIRNSGSGACRGLVDGLMRISIRFQSRISSELIVRNSFIRCFS